MDIEGLEWNNAIEACEGGKNSDNYAEYEGFGNMELGAVIKAGAVSVFDKPIERDVFLAKVKNICLRKI